MSNMRVGINYCNYFKQPRNRLYKIVGVLSFSQKKVSAHARQREHFTSGEWSTGNKWADDKPRENVDGDAINLMTSGACGAFVHGLEDEYLGMNLKYKTKVCS